MAKIKRVSNDPGLLIFFCPGCNEHHQVRISPYGKPVWEWNNLMDKPTFKPSLLIRSGHYVPGHKKTSCWCTYNEENKDNPAPFKCTVCHSFITDGMIQFLNDCTHELAGKTVQLPELH